MTANPEAFEAYFRMADADRDGRISGAEAVTFFQGSGLPQVTLAKIWQFAGTGHTGYLSKAEFFDALKLVTVAQSGRDLSPDLVRSALVGPAASQIPAPKIVTAAAFPQSGVLGAGLATQQVSSGGSTTPRPLQLPAQFPGSEVKQGLATPGSEAGRLAGLMPAVPDASSALLFGNLGLDAWVKPSTGSTSGTVKQEIRTSTPATTVSLHDVFSDGEFKAAPAGPGSTGVAATGTINVSNVTASATIPDSKGSFSTGPTRSNASTPYGFDAFTAYNLKPSSPPQGSRSIQNLGHSSGLEAGEKTPRGMAPNMSAAQRTQPLPQSGSTAQTIASSRLKQAVPVVQRQSFALPAWDFGGGPDESQEGGSAWPKMTRIELERYSKMFLQIDTDRDGKITGTQARELFLGWRLATDMLKQVWDLADQDLDGMLSQREFCTAMYFIERFREGRPVPLFLPTGFYLEDPIQVLPSAIPGQVSLSGQRLPGSQTVPGGLPGQVPSDEATAARPENQNQSKVPVLDPTVVSQLPREEQETLTTKHREAKELEQQVLEVERDAVGTTQKIDYYRAKLQELVSKSMFRILFKSRSEKELTDLTERAAADKRELEILPRKFDEKVKELNDANARLVAQDEGYQDIQRRKAELSDAIGRLEQVDLRGESQARADRLWSELDQLRKTFSSRCQQLGLRVNPVNHSFDVLQRATYGHPDSFTKYDDHWDKFHDEEPVKSVVSSSLSRNSPIPSGAGRPGAEQTHQDLRSQTHPVGKSNLGIPAASSRPVDTHHVFGEPQTFDWRDAYHEENDSSTKSKGRYEESPRLQASELRQTPQFSSHSETLEARGRDRSQQGYEDHHYRLATVRADKSASLQKDNVAHGSPIFSSSPLHPKLAPGVDAHQESREVQQSASYSDAARYDDDPFVGMGPFGS